MNLCNTKYGMKWLHHELTIFALHCEIQLYFYFIYLLKWCNIYVIYCTCMCIFYHKYAYVGSYFALYLHSFFTLLLGTRFSTIYLYKYQHIRLEYVYCFSLSYIRVCYAILVFIPICYSDVYWIIEKLWWYHIIL